MTLRIAARAAARALALAALAIAPGCLGTAQARLDLLLGRSALENAIRLPYSTVAPLLRVFLGGG